jgi:hypothetical protein
MSSTGRSTSQSSTPRASKPQKGGARPKLLREAYNRGIHNDGQNNALSVLSNEEIKALIDDHDEKKRQARRRRGDHIYK